MKNDFIAAKSIFGIVLLLFLLGVAILGGDLFDTLPFFVRLFIAALLMTGGGLLARWYIRRI